MLIHCRKLRRNVSASYASVVSLWPWFLWPWFHYNGVIMSAMAFQVTSVCLFNRCLFNVYPGADHKHTEIIQTLYNQSFAKEILHSQMNSPHTDLEMWSWFNTLWWCIHITTDHYNDVIMSAMVSQITSVWLVCSAVCSGADQRKH